MKQFQMQMLQVQVVGGGHASASVSLLDDDDPDLISALCTGMHQHVMLMSVISVKWTSSGKHHLSFHTFSHLITDIRQDKTEPTYYMSYHIKHRIILKKFCMK